MYYGKRDVSPPHYDPLSSNTLILSLCHFLKQFWDSCLSSVFSCVVRLLESPELIQNIYLLWSFWFWGKSQNSHCARSGE